MAATRQPEAVVADVIIIGAGVAGLAAAAELQAHQPGLRVAMIEAREYVGGRVVSAPLPSGESPDSTVRSHGEVLWTDAGAAWVHGTEGNPMMQWLSEDDVVSVSPQNPWMSPSSATAQIFYVSDTENVTPLTQQEQDGAVGAAAAVMASVNEEAQALVLRGSDPSATADIPASAGFQKALRRCVSAETNPQVRAGLSWWMWMVECWMGAGLGELQLAEFIATDLWGDFPGPHCLPHPLPSPERAREVSFPCSPPEAVSGCSGGARLVQSLAKASSAAQVWTCCAVTSVSTADEEGLGGRWCPADRPSSEPATSTSRGVWCVHGTRTQAVGCDGPNEAYRAWVGPPTAMATASEDGGGMEWTAPVVISTLPLGVLQKNTVRFSPSLPPSTHGSVRQLRMGQYKKVVLRFSRRWWPESASPIWGVVNESDTHFQHILDAEAAAETSRQWEPRATGTTDDSPASEGGVSIRVRYIENYEQMKGPAWEGVVGVVFVGPDVARLAAEFVTNEQLIHHCVRAMRIVAAGLCGEQSLPIPEPLVSVAVTAWERDPWSRGAYSYFPRGAADNANDTLAQPWSCVWRDGDNDVAAGFFMAGEATDGEYMGSVHAALNSGKRAANEVLQWWAQHSGQS